MNSQRTKTDINPMRPRRDLSSTGAAERARETAEPDAAGDQQVIIASDPEQAQDLGTAAYYPQRLKVLEAEHPFKMQVRTNTLNSLTLGDLTYNNSAVEIDCAELRTAYHVNIPLRGAIDSELSHTIARATPQRATIYRPTGRTLLRKWHASTRALTLKVERTAVEGHLQSMLGRTWSGTVDFDASLDIGQGLGASWWTMVRHLDEQLSADESADNLARFPLLAHHLEYGIIVGLLLAADHSLRPELQEPGRPVRPRAVRRPWRRLSSSRSGRSPSRAWRRSPTAASAGCRSRSTSMWE